MAEQIIMEYWNNQWATVFGNKEFEDYSQSIPNDFRKEIPKHSNLFSVILSAKQIMDFGCGTGHMIYTLSRFSYAHCIGVEISETAVEYATKKYPNVEFLCQDLLDIKTEFEVDGVIVCSNVLEHFKNPYFVIDRLIDRCKYLLILVPNEGTANDGYSGEGGAGHVFLFNKESFLSYETIDIFDFFSNGWTCGENPRQLVILLKGRL